MPCIFCGQQSVTKAHVLPQWLEGITVKPNSLTQRRVGLPPSKRREPKLYAENVRVVCQERCNGGWMNRLEDAAKEAVTSLVHGEQMSLRPLGQIAVARWASMVALLACYLQPKLHVPRDYPALFYNFKEPPPITAVWIASYDLAGGRAESYLRGPLRIPWSDRPPLPRPAGAVERPNINGYAITINVWHFAFKVMVFEPPPGWSERTHLTVKINFDRKVPGAIPIWPKVQPEGLSWPINPPIDDLGLMALANAKPVVTPNSAP